MRQKSKLSASVYQKRGLFLLNWGYFANLLSCFDFQIRNRVSQKEPWPEASALVLLGRAWESSQGQWLSNIRYKRCLISILAWVLSEHNLSWFLFSLDGGIRCSEAEVWGGLLKAKNSCKKKMEGRIKCSLNNRGKETQPKGFNFCKIRETRTKIVDPKQTRPTWSCLQLQCVWMSLWIVFFLITIIPV